MVGVAQLVRASVCGTEGRGFEYHRPPKITWYLWSEYGRRNLTVNQAERKRTTRVQIPPGTPK